MKRPSFIFGYCIIKANKTDVEKIINLCNANSIIYSDIRLEEEKVFFSIALLHKKRFIKLCSSYGITAEPIAHKGLPSLFLRHRKRIGLPLGALIGILFLVFSSGLVWDIRIDGAITVSEREVLDTLKDCGLYIGTKTKSIDADVLETQALILSDKISWISINMSGTVANVEIRELDEAPQEDDGIIYSNVVAKCEGVIVGFEEISGSPAVKIGDAVCKGQLLISGLVGDELKPMRFMRAEGKVFSEVEETVEIKIPQKYTKKTANSVLNEEKSLIFFENEIKFFSNCRNCTSSCDKIDILESFYTINQKKLPFAIKTLKHIEYTETELERSESELERIATEKLFRLISEEFKDAQILSRSSSSTFENGIYTLRCKIKCIRNIAEIREIELTS